MPITSLCYFRKSFHLMTGFRIRLRPAMLYMHSPLHSHINDTMDGNCKVIKYQEYSLRKLYCY